MSYLDQNNRYTIENFHTKSAFASFLPGIAGPLGVPLWAFYVNRGQGMVSFGIQDKDNPIVEFRPANQAYQTVFTHGFRTFIKNEAGEVYEPFTEFRPLSPRETGMQIGLNDLILSETNPAAGVQTEVLYFTLPSEPYAALVRKVTVTNIGGQTFSGEILDGLPAIIPFGVGNWLLKEMSNTVTAWMGVENLENNIPFYKVRSSIEDRPEVEEFQAGHFYAVFSEKDYQLAPIVDPALIFEHNTAMTYPAGFMAFPLEKLLRKKQVDVGKVPCGFFGMPFSIAPGNSLTLTGLIGHAGNLDMVNKRSAAILNAEFIKFKHTEAINITEKLTAVAATQTGDPTFDRYCRQTYLDNVLRGGQPMLFPTAGKPHVFHLYSRKHGDLERDYNFFTTRAEHYSQGNGNFRDVCQNRRSDVFFNPEIDDHNIVTFMNFIQADGYNPLVIQENTFALATSDQAALVQTFSDDAQPLLQEVLSRPFTPGQLVQVIENHLISLQKPAPMFLQEVLARATLQANADHHEGYWVDHWTYCLDLIDSYRTVFPDRDQTLFFSEKYTYFDDPHIVRPRKDKYVEVDGEVRQYDAVALDAEKKAVITLRKSDPHLMHTRKGIYRTTLFGKLLNLAAIKFATLDPGGMGIEMEAGKPGWYDALNGLPALFGSSVAETYELKRLLELLIRTCHHFPETQVRLPIEVWALINDLVKLLEDDFKYWQKTSDRREAYREKTKFGFAGDEEAVSLREVMPHLAKFLRRIEAGLQKASKLNDGLPPTYFRYEAVNWTRQTNADGAGRLDAKGRPLVTVTEFKPIAMPLFLEGAVKAIKLSRTPDDARKFHTKVKKSGLYDPKLKMFKVNISLQDQPMAIGRTRAFTPGWLENESIFMHMHYKYLLALLKAGLSEEFWAEAKNGLAPFFDPAVYGRSVLEHSSFIASSVHPDESIHGKGFVARLSGATAEFLDMWRLILLGPQPFAETPAGMVFQPRPQIPGWLFKADGTLRFQLFGKIQITYCNPHRKNTFPGNSSLIREFEILDHHQKMTKVSPQSCYDHIYLTANGSPPKIKEIRAYF